MVCKSLAVTLLLQTVLWPLIASQSSASISATPVRTTALPGTDTPRKHWKPDRPDPYVCEYLGENGCWQPTVTGEGPPYSGFESPRPPRTKTCVVKACNDPSGDDAPAIIKAFKDCREDSHIIFKDTDYYIASVMNTTGMRNVDVEVRGTLNWNNKNIEYWLNNSLPVSFAEG